MNSYDEKIKNHYDDVARSEGASSSSTMADETIRNTETKFIVDMLRSFIESGTLEKLQARSRLERSLSLIDVGCGNGYTLKTISNSFDGLRLSGLELNDSLRSIAMSALSGLDIPVKRGDIREYDSTLSAGYDVVICQRVLINLLSVEDQRRAFSNLVRSTNEGGLLILIEGFDSGLESLNEARQEFGLEPLTPAHHNLYLDDKFFENEDLVDYDLSRRDELSTHYFVTRVIHPLFLRAFGAEFQRNSHFVKFFGKALKPGIGSYAQMKLVSYKKVKAERG